MSVHTCPGTEQFLNPTLPLNNRLSDARIVPVHTHSGTELFRNPTLSLDNQLSEAIEIHNMLVSSIRNVKGFYSETHHRLHYCYSFLRKLESTRSQVDSDEYNYRRNYNIRKRGRLGVEMHHLRKRWTRLLEKVKDAKQRVCERVSEHELIQN